MKAAVYYETGGPEVFRYSSWPRTAGGPGSRSKPDGKVSKRALSDHDGEDPRRTHPLVGSPSHMLMDVTRLERASATPRRPQSIQQSR